MVVVHKRNDGPTNRLVAVVTPSNKATLPTSAFKTPLPTRRSSAFAAKAIEKQTSTTVVVSPLEKPCSPKIYSKMPGLSLHAKAWLVFILAIFFLVPLSYRYIVASTQLSILSHKIKTLTEQVSDERKRLFSARIEVRGFEKRVREIEIKNKELLLDVRQALPTMYHQTELKHMEGIMKDRMDSLMKRIQIDSSRELIDRYGKGPHFVEFTLTPKSVSRSKKKSVEFEPFKIVIKLAPVKMMPLSVNQFLQMVEQGLWEGTMFVFQPNHHVIQSSPTDVRTAKSVEDRFDNSDLTYGKYLPFPEYTDEYPHRKYTVGFAGGLGPAFYINMEDNTSNHGPGGQVENVLHEEAEPCFGEVISGLESIDDYFRTDEPPPSPNTPLDRRAIKIVAIDRVRLLKDYEETKQYTS